MKNKVFRTIICFALIISLVLGEATMAFATNSDDKYKDWEVVNVELKNYSFAEGENYAYTGTAIKPTLSSLDVDITYKNTDGSETAIVNKSINAMESTELSFKNNVSIGTGYVVATVEGQKIELPFNIVFGKIKSIQATSTSNTKIKISWNKVAGAAGYIVYRSTQSSGKFKAIKTITSGGTTSYTNTGLKLGNVYYYKVLPYRKVDGSTVEGEYSSTVKKTVQPATPTIKSVKRKTYNSLKITWSKVSDATGYRVYRSTSEGGTYKRIATLRGAKKVSYIDKKRSCGKKYFYKVKAYKTVKLKKYYGTATKAASGRTTPSGTKFNDGTMSWRNSVELKWNKSAGATGYVIYRSNKSGSGYAAIKTVTGKKTLKYIDKGLNGNSVYYYKVRPFVQVGKEKVYGTYSKAYTKYLVSGKLETLVKKYEGKPYKFGGNTPKGWDCSGFVQWAINYLYGKKIPRTGSGQARGGKYVNKNKMSTWKPGDVLIYKRNGGGVSHVGLYIGGGKMMHALNSRYDTVIQGVSYYEKWDRGNYLAGVRRY